MEHGQLLVLWQPAELVIICGASLGTLLIANPLPTLIRVAKGLVAVLKGNRYPKKRYLESLQMLNALFALGAQGRRNQARSRCRRPQQKRRL